MTGPVAGIGARPGVRPDQLRDLVVRLERAAGTRLRHFATLDRRRTEVAEALTLCLGEQVFVEGVAAEVLAQVDVPHPSPVVRSAVGTASVAEAAALAVAERAGRAELVVPKTIGHGVTGAVAHVREQ